MQRGQILTRYIHPSLSLLHFICIIYSFLNSSRKHFLKHSKKRLRPFLNTLRPKSSLNQPLANSFHIQGKSILFGKSFSIAFSILIYYIFIITPDRYQVSDDFFQKTNEYKIIDLSNNYLKQLSPNQKMHASSLYLKNNLIVDFPSLDNWKALVSGEYYIIIPKKLQF